MFKFYNQGEKNLESYKKTEHRAVILRRLEVHLFIPRITFGNIEPKKVNKCTFWGWRGEGFSHFQLNNMVKVQTFLPSVASAWKRKMCVTYLNNGCTELKQRRRRRQRERKKRNRFILAKQQLSTRTSLILGYLWFGGSRLRARLAKQSCSAFCKQQRLCRGLPLFRFIDIEIKWKTVQVGLFHLKSQVKTICKGIGELEYGENWGYLSFLCQGLRRVSSHLRSFRNLKSLLNFDAPNPETLSAIRVQRPSD